MRCIARTITLMAVLTACNPAVQAQTDILINEQDIKISISDLDAALAQLPEEKRREILRNKTRLQEFTADLYSQQVIKRRAEELQLLESEEVVNRLEALRHYVLREAVLQHDYENQTEEPDFDQLAEEYYLSHQDEYAQPRRIRLAQIYLPADSCNEEQVMEQARQIISDIKQGTDFAKLAEQYSKGPNAAQGGEFKDWMVEREDIQNPVVKAAFALTEEQPVSDPIRSQRGFHILKLIENEPAHIQPFNEVKNRLVKKLEKDYQQQTNERLMETYRPASGVNQTALETFLDQ